MSEFLNRISKLSPRRLALLADELNERVHAAEGSRRVRLAIVGIGCHLPGGVKDPESFWTLLSEGVDAVGEVPASRWAIDEFYDSNPDAPGKMATRWGGFIDDPDQFDPKFFGIAPAEAISMDPQQRLLLETAWEALEDAGIAPSSLSGTATGVYVGICNSDYGQFALDSPREKITPYFAAGLSHAVAAGRISYVLGLQGPSMAVDTSCSASLVAVHLACQSLRLGECDAALAGGVNLIFNPDVTIALSQSRMMAPDGKCKAFSDFANGFVRGEGCGMIVLKRLPDAVRDRNRILAVIRGSACNQDGRSSGLTAPNGPSQEAVVATALGDAGLRPDDVGYVEAHGTGTALGDPIELGALNSVFASRSAESGPLFVGSVKTNLGHLESAAGIAGLIKLVLSIQHGKIPASLHLGKPNSRVEWERLPIQVPTQLHDWDRRPGRRTGGVSSFGFSGTNAHVIVEEYVEVPRPGTQQGMEPTQPATTDADRPLLFPLSARTESALETMVAKLARHLAEHPLLPLAEIARTLNTGRSHFEYRAALVAATQPELLGLLRVRRENRAAVGTLQIGRVVAHSPRVAFIFSDDESFARNTARELYEASPVFRQAVLRCEEILRADLEHPLTSLLYRETHGGEEKISSNGMDDLPARYRKAMTFAGQYALAELWRSCAIKSVAVWGWGTGEYVAGCIAGVFGLEDGLRMAVAQGRRDDAELVNRAETIAYSSAQLSFVLNEKESAGVRVDSADYWLRRRSNAPSAAGQSTLAMENCAATVVIGGPAILQSLESPGVDLPGKLLASLGSGSDACRQFLNTAAALYVVGCEIDMSRLYGDGIASTVSLPTYPFERERYWISTDERRDGARGADLKQAPTGAKTQDEEWMYELVWEQKSLSNKTPNQVVIVTQPDREAPIKNRLSTGPRREWIIFADRFGVGDALGRSLADLGEHYEIVQHPESASEMFSAFRELRDRSNSCALEIVYLWGMDVADPGVSASALSTETELSGTTLIHLIQTLLTRGKDPGRLSIVTRGAQATEFFSPNVAGAVQSLAWGVGRVLGLEAPEHYGALIDIDPALSPRAAAVLVAGELLGSDGEDQIAYRDGRRLVARLRRSTLRDSSGGSSAAASLRKDGSYLLVGGLGGVGLQVAKWAAEQHAGHLVLLGRTGTGSSAGPFAADRVKAIAEIERLGAKVTVVEGDVASEADIRVLFRRFGGELPPLHGVFHAATAVSGAELANLTDEQIETMLRPKVLGTWVLHEMTKNLDLDFFVVFSSAASLLGAKGMAHYAAANQFLDTFAHYRRAAGLPMLSVNWGAWDVMRLASSEGQGHFTKTGLLPMSSGKLLALFGDLIAYRRAQVMIANIDWNILKPVFETQRTRPLLENFGDVPARHGNRTVASLPPLVSLHAATGMRREERGKFIEAFVLKQAAHVLGFRRGEVPPVDVPLIDLGLDSLMAVDLKNRLQTGLGQELSPTVVFDCPTVSEMTEMLDTMLWAAHGNLEDDLATSQKDEIRI